MQNTVEDISNQAQGHKANLSNPSEFTSSSYLPSQILIIGQTPPRLPRSTASRF